MEWLEVTKYGISDLGLIAANNRFWTFFDEAADVRHLTSSSNIFSHFLGLWCIWWIKNTQNSTIFDIYSPNALSNRFGNQYKCLFGIIWDLLFSTNIIRANDGSKSPIENNHTFCYKTMILIYYICLKKYYLGKNGFGYFFKVWQRWF